MTVAERNFAASLPAPAYPKDAPLSGLCSAELLLTLSLRLFAAGHHDPQNSHDWRGGLLAANAGCHAAQAFEALFSIVAASAQRSLDVGCRHCPVLSHDEARFLQLISLLQHGHMFDARDVLSDWLPRAAVRAAIVPAKILASSLANVRLLVPQRSFAECGAVHHISALVH